MAPLITHSRSQFFILLVGFAFSLLMLSQCGRNKIDTNQIIQLQQEAAKVRHQFPAGMQSHEMPAPSQLSLYRELNIKSIRVTREGIYFVQSSFFVTESGLFIPSDRKRVFTDGGDPAYFLISDGIYRYQIKG